MKNSNNNSSWYCDKESYSGKEKCKIQCELCKCLPENEIQLAKVAGEHNQANELFKTLNNEL